MIIVIIIVMALSATHWRQARLNGAKRDSMAPGATHWRQARLNGAKRDSLAPGPTQLPLIT
jgi:hypothetical protein